MKIDGKCHCGEIAIEAEINPEFTVICHCTDCQTISGAPYRVSVVAPTRLFRLTGTPRIYRKRGDSGNEVELNFCPICGTALFSSRGPDAPFHFLRIGIIRQRAELPPRMQGFCESALPWSMDIRGIPLAEPRKP